MNGVLVTALQLPASCRLEKRVFKKLFLGNAKLTPPDRRAFTNDVEEVMWTHTLKPSTIAIMPYKDDEREYDEIAVLEARLKAPRNASRIAEVIHRAIPYPLVLVVRHETRELLSLAPKRFSRSEKGATVAEEFFSTAWLETRSLSDIERQFTDSIAVRNLPQANYESLYSGLADRVVALHGSCRTGEYHVVADRERMAQLRQMLAEADDLEKTVDEYRAELKRESQYNRRVEISTRIQDLQARMASLDQRLTKGEW